MSYQGLQYLEQDIDYLENQKLEYINLCLYEIETSGIYPFLKFIFSLNKEKQIYEFPKFNISYYDFSTETFNTIIKQYIYELLYSSLINLDTFKQRISLKGYYFNNNELYLFIDVSTITYGFNDINKIKDFNCGIVYEIINSKHICSIPIDDSITYFFINNTPFYTLTSLDEDNTVIEIPISLYSLEKWNEIGYKYLLGLSKEEGIFGWYYYFTNYNNLFYQYKKYYYGEKMGYIRHAVFIGYCNYKRNYCSEPLDKSKQKQLKLKEYQEKCDEIKYERITDYDGNWAKEYDSVYLGKIADFVEDAPLYAIKLYEQHVLLSYHEIQDDKN
jgi:hypothetical protein